MRAAAARGIPVVLVQDDAGPGLWAPDTPGWQLHRRLTRPPTAVYLRKRFGDAFRSTDLDARLRRTGAGNLVLAGAMTDFSVRATLQRALLKGYFVTLVADAHSTLDAPDSSAAEQIALLNGEVRDAEVRGLPVRLVRSARPASSSDSGVTMLFYVASVPGWTGIELRHFLALDAVATERSFHRAARKLGYTQSAISQQIATLERVVGHRLIERPGGSQPVLRLIRAGEIVLEHAHAIGARLATAQADLQAFAAGNLDPLRLGFFGRGLGALMPGICRRLQDDRPDLEIKISEAREDEELLGMIRRGEIDLAFVHLPLDGEECEEVALLEDDHVLVVRNDPAAATRAASLSLEELAAGPLIGFKHCSQLTGSFRSRNLEPSWFVCSDDLESIYAFVAAGSGVAVLPQLATLALGDGVQVVQPTCELPPRHLGLAWSSARGESGSARAFVDAAVAEAARFSRGRLSLAS